MAGRICSLTNLLIDESEFLRLNMVDLQRYARHISIPSVGQEGQEKISQSKVLVIGAGGLGSPVILYLAAAGVGKIGIVDDDDIEISNLQRQVIHAESKLGQNKAESAKNRILELNPTINVEFWNQRLTPDNAKEIFSDYDIVVDGTDNIPTRYLIDDMCRVNSIPWVYGSIYRFEGQVSLFNFNNGPCYRDLFPEPPPSNSIPSCAEGGVFGVLPGVIGSIQATEVLKTIIGNGKTLSGRLLLYDAESMDFKTLKYSKNEATPEVDMEQVRAMFEENGWCKNTVAGKGEIQEPIDTGSVMFKHLSMSEYKDKKASGWQPFLVDVRTDMEYSQMHISFTDLQINHEDILSKVDLIPKNSDVILLCRSGMRSQMAAMYLMNAGYDGNKLYNLDGGIMAWNNALPADVE